MSDAFATWLSNLRDTQANVRIAKRIKHMQQGTLGDVKPVGAGISEARIHYGKGYRLYFIQRGEAVIILLCGGDKKSQQNDIAKAKQLAKEWS